MMYKAFASGITTGSPNYLPGERHHLVIFIAADTEAAARAQIATMSRWRDLMIEKFDVAYPESVAEIIAELGGSPGDLQATLERGEPFVVIFRQKARWWWIPDLIYRWRERRHRRRHRRRANKSALQR